MKLILSVLATASALACNVNAATLDWGNHSALEIGAASTPVGSFADTYLFSLTSAMSLSSSAVSINLGSMLGLTGGTVTLFADVLGPDLKVGSYAFSGTTGSAPHSFGELLAGNYYYVVAGLGTGTLGGYYALASESLAIASVVPEPSTAMLMLAGLGIFGFKSQRLLKRV